MGPTLDRIYADAYVPLTKNAISFEQALEKGEGPIRGFMVKQTRQSDFSLFAKLAKLPPEVKADTAPLRRFGPGVRYQRTKVGISDWFHDFYTFFGY